MRRCRLAAVGEVSHAPPRVFATTLLLAEDEAHGTASTIFASGRIPPVVMLAIGIATDAAAARAAFTASAAVYVAKSRFTVSRSSNIQFSARLRRKEHRKSSKVSSVVCSASHIIKDQQRDATLT
jgi:hypothetical protein